MKTSGPQLTSVEAIERRRHKFVYVRHVTPYRWRFRSRNIVLTLFKKQPAPKISNSVLRLIHDCCAVTGKMTSRHTHERFWTFVPSSAVITWNSSSVSRRCVRVLIKKTIWRRAGTTLRNRWDWSPERANVACSDHREHGRRRLSAWSTGRRGKRVAIAGLSRRSATVLSTARWFYPPHQPVLGVHFFARRTTISRRPNNRRHGHPKDAFRNAPAPSTLVCRSYFEFRRRQHGNDSVVVDHRETRLPIQAR